MYGVGRVGILTTWTALINTKNVIGMMNFTSKFFWARPWSRHTFCSTCITAGAPQWSSSPCYFSHPPPVPDRRPPGWGWGRAACSTPLANSPTVRMLSKMVKKPRQKMLRMPCLSKLAPSSSPCPSVGATILPTSWRASNPCQEWMNWFGHQPMSLSEFPAGPSPLQRWYRQWKLVHRGASRPPPPVSPPLPFL